MRIRLKLTPLVDRSCQDDTVIHYAAKEMLLFKPGGKTHTQKVLQMNCMPGFIQAGSLGVTPLYFCPFYGLHLDFKQLALFKFSFFILNHLLEKF
jgi:hypothetical protein